VKSTAQLGRAFLLLAYSMVSVAGHFTDYCIWLQKCLVSGREGNCPPANLLSLTQT
jgi:hypothetical protein